MLQRDSILENYMVLNKRKTKKKGKSAKEVVKYF